jgi:hypothetical protein
MACVCNQSRWPGIKSPCGQCFKEEYTASVDFYRGWPNGFADLNGNVWLTLEKIYCFTKSDQNWLDFNHEKAYAKYGTFSEASKSESDKLKVCSFSNKYNHVRKMLLNVMPYTDSNLTIVLLKDSTNSLRVKLYLAVYFLYCTSEWVGVVEVSFFTVVFLLQLGILLEKKLVELLMVLHLAS